MTKLALATSGLIAALCSVVPSTVAAQSLDQALQPDRAPVPVAPQPTEPERFALPELSDISRSKQSLATTEPLFSLTDIIVAPTSLLSKAEIDRITQPYINRQITLSEVAFMRDQLTAKLIGKGYISSGAVIPEQDVSDGILDVLIVEGQLNKVTVTGTNYLSESYFSRRVNLGQTIRKDGLETSFQLLLEDPNIVGLDARLIPGIRPGEATLELKVREKPRSEMSAYVASDRSPAVGATRGGVRGRYASLIRAGDMLSGEAAATEGMVEARLNYSVPIVEPGVLLTFAAQGSRAQVVEAPLNALDAVSSSGYLSVGVSYALRSEPGRALRLNMSADHIRVRTSILGMPFSFSPGAVDGVTEYSTLRTSLNWTYYSSQRSYAVSLSHAHGLQGDKQATDVNPHFQHISLAGSFIQRVGNTTQQVVIKGEIREADGTMYATEGFSIGGADTVRGFRQNALLGREGAWISAEYQWPLASLGLAKAGEASRLPDWADLSRITVSAFVDVGHIETADAGAGLQKDLSSVGVRLVWLPTDRVRLDAFAARRLSRRPVPGNSYVDDGFGINLAVRF